MVKKMNSKTYLGNLSTLLMCVCVVTCVLTNFGYYSIHTISLCIFFMYEFYKTKHNKLLINKKTSLVIVMSIVISLLSISQRNYSDIFKFIKWFILSFAGYVFIKRYDSENQKKVCNIVLIIIFLACIEGLVQYFSNKISLVDYLVPWGDNLRQGTVSIFLQHIVWGHVIIVGFVLSSCITNNKLRLLYKTILLINLYLCQSRSAWLTFFVYLLYLYFPKIRNILFKKMNKTKVLVSFVTFLLLLILLVLNMNSVSKVFDTIIDHLGMLLKGESNYRTNTIKSLLDYRISNPNLLYLLFGSGYSSSKIALENSGLFLSGNRYIVDNQIISIAFEFGIIAFAYVISMFIKSFKKQNNQSNIDKLINLLFICNFCMSLVYESFGYEVTSFIMFFVFGAKIALNEKKKEEKDVQIE